jgi:hypothetical protein
LLSETRDMINSVLNKEELPHQKEPIIALIYEKGQ